MLIFLIVATILLYYFYFKKKLFYWLSIYTLSDKNGTRIINLEDDAFSIYSRQNEWESASVFKITCYFPFQAKLINESAILKNNNQIIKVVLNSQFVLSKENHLLLFPDNMISLFNYENIKELKTNQTTLATVHESFSTKALFKKCRYEFFEEFFSDDFKASEFLKRTNKISSGRRKDEPRYIFLLCDPNIYDENY